MKKRVYVSLPITGRPVEEAREHADRVKAALSRKGYEVTTPFDIVHGTDAEYADYIGADITVMLKQDIVCFATGWDRSFGCLMERSTLDIYNAKMRTERKPKIGIIYE